MKSSTREKPRASPAHEKSAERRVCNRTKYSRALARSGFWEEVRNTQNELKLGSTFWSLRVAARLTGAALLYNLRLMTRNVDDVKHISGLQIINPFATLD